MEIAENSENLKILELHENAFWAVQSKKALFKSLKSESESINLLIEFPELVCYQLGNPGIHSPDCICSFFAAFAQTTLAQKHSVIIILCNACANQAEKTFVITQKSGGRKRMSGTFGVNGRKIKDLDILEG